MHRRPDLECDKSMISKAMNGCTLARRLCLGAFTREVGDGVSGQIRIHHKQQDATGLRRHPGLVTKDLLSCS